MYPYNIARDVFMAEPECFMFPGHMKLYLEKKKKKETLFGTGELPLRKITKAFTVNPRFHRN